jgi:predicted  nucleic acid-binding Zn-ribbon protein
MEQRSAPDTDVSDRITALEADNAKLKKKLDMAMGAIQASTAQLMAVKRELSQSQQTSRQAMQAATSALATAESAVEGVTDLETKLSRARLGPNARGTP